MEEIIGKYEAKLKYISDSIDRYRPMLDADELENLTEIRVLLVEVVNDFKAIKLLVK